MDISKIQPKGAKDSILWIVIIEWFTFGANTNHNLKI